MKRKLALLINIISERSGRLLGTLLSLTNKKQKIAFILFLKSLLGGVAVFSTFGYRVYIVIDACIDSMLRKGKDDLWFEESLLNSTIHLNINNIPSRTMYLGVYENVIVDYLKNNVKTGMTFIDVGANIGYYSLIASQLVGDTGHVVGFEPENKNYELLTQNIKRNGYDNVATFKVGLASKEASATLYLNPRNKGAHSLQPSRFLTDASEEVPIVVFDSFSKSINIPALKVDIIKIDVEGFEYDVLVGMKEAIERDKPVIICEVSRDHQKIFNLLGQFGYSISFFDHRLGEVVYCEEMPDKLGKKDYLFKPQGV